MCSRSFLLILGLTLVYVTSSNQHSYHEFNGNEYLVNDDDIHMTIDEAKKFCADNGYEMVDIEDDEEKALVDGLRPSGVVCVRSGSSETELGIQDTGVSTEEYNLAYVEQFKEGLESTKSLQKTVDVINSHLKTVEERFESVRVDLEGHGNNRTNDRASYNRMHQIMQQSYSEIKKLATDKTSEIRDQLNDLAVEVELRRKDVIELKKVRDIVSKEIETKLNVIKAEVSGQIKESNEKLSKSSNQENNKLIARITSLERDLNTNAKRLTSYDSKLPEMIGNLEKEKEKNRILAEKVARLEQKLSSDVPNNSD
jgi:glycine cleavage system H lipoate-binding protein